MPYTAGGPSPPAVYAEAVATYTHTIGGLDFAAPQDWMCEPFMLERTGLSIAEHQERTVANYLHLRAITPELPFIPVLQGWHLADRLPALHRPDPQLQRRRPSRNPLPAGATAVDAAPDG
ncbi:hypothetical protein GCM10009677_06810 [Sphaerisporangium rubeum]|uniref:deazapurine DNA modification protein DpdA family protein n=1 Tax=Sphaerisporangium rubeum TaxID=321317 RepID=UPI00337C9F27